MADAALAQVNGARTVFAGVRSEGAGPRDVVRIDINDAGFGIHRGAAPLRAAVEARKNDRVDCNGKRNKLSFAAKFLELFERPPMNFRSAVGEHLFRKKLACEGRGARRKWLRGRRAFARNSAARILANVDGEKRLPREAVEEINKTLLRGLRNGFHVFAVAVYGEERGRRREIAVPNVVMNALKVPDFLACFRVQGDQAIGEEVVTNAVSAVKIKSGRACGHVKNSALGIESHARPVVCGPGSFPRPPRPGFVTEFAGVRNGVKRPAQFAGENVISANVAGRRGEGLRVAAADDDEVLVDDSRAGEINGLGADGLTAQVFAQIDSSLSSKLRNRPAGGGLESVEKIQSASQDALVFAVAPVGKPAVRLRTVDA